MKYYIICNTILEMNFLFKFSSYAFWTALSDEHLHMYSFSRFVVFSFQRIGSEFVLLGNEHSANILQDINT